MISTLEWMRFIVLQIFFWLSASVFAYPLKRREKFVLRAICFSGIIIIYSVIFVAFLWDGSYGTEFLCRIFSAALLVIFLHSGWDTKLSLAIYNAIWSISIWQILEEIWYMIEFLGKDYFEKFPYMTIVGMIVLYIVNYMWVAKTIGKWMPIDRKDYIGPRQLGSAILIFGIIEVLAMSPVLRHAAEHSYEWRFLYVSQFLAVVILYLQSELFKKSSIKQELELMNLLWKNKQEQYELAKENIELINQKSHDLKHQIRALKKLNKEEFDAYLHEIEESVEIYESIVKTGNDVFDTILTEKSLYCKKRNIQVTCVADGSQMEFINAIDLYAILGNALDNAIEAVEKFEEPEKRQIDVIIRRQKNFLVMNFMNPVSKKLVFENGFPVTTKGDRRYHGFGLRSIQHFAKKYDGVLNISEEDDCFSLKIMIPILHNR